MSKKRNCDFCGHRMQTNNCITPVGEFCTDVCYNKWIEAYHRCEVCNKTSAKKRVAYGYATYYCDNCYEIHGKHTLHSHAYEIGRQLGELIDEISKTSAKLTSTDFEKLIRIIIESLGYVSESQERIKQLEEELLTWQESETILGEELARVRKELSKLKSEISWDRYPEGMGR